MTTKFYSIELYKNRGQIIGYPNGTPPLSMKIDDCRDFHIYRHILCNDILDSVDLKYYFILFQRMWRKWKAFRRRIFKILRTREIYGKSKIITYI
jgi:hypothetical protein